MMKNGACLLLLLLLLLAAACSDGTATAPAEPGERFPVEAAARVLDTRYHADSLDVIVRLENVTPDSVEGITFAVALLRRSGSGWLDAGTSRRFTVPIALMPRQYTEGLVRLPAAEHDCWQMDVALPPPHGRKRFAPQCAE